VLSLGCGWALAAAGGANTNAVARRSRRAVITLAVCRIAGQPQGLTAKKKHSGL
jgi:hypothetical protein